MTQTQPLRDESPQSPGNILQGLIEEQAPVRKNIASLSLRLSQLVAEEGVLNARITQELARNWMRQSDAQSQLQLSRRQLESMRGNELNAFWFDTRWYILRSDVEFELQEAAWKANSRK